MNRRIKLILSSRLIPAVYLVLVLASVSSEVFLRILAHTHCRLKRPLENTIAILSLLFIMLRECDESYLMTALENIPGKIRNQFSAVEERAANSAFQMVLNPTSIQQAMFQHSVLCQTFLPYRNPGNHVTIWNQKQGAVNLAVQATQQLNPRTGDYEVVGLPFGTKARLILAYLNSEAVKTQNKIIDVEHTMTAFIRRLGLSNDGRTIRDVKDQIKRLTSSIINMGYSKDGRGTQVNLQIVKAFDLWFPKDDRQRVIWTPTIMLTDDYFESLLEHAIPLDERALVALSHNSMALDIYAWLAQRLHRIDPAKPQFVGWQNLKEQFGSNYSEMRKFKQVFRNTLKQVHTQYCKANVIEIENKACSYRIPHRLFQTNFLQILTCLFQRKNNNSKNHVQFGTQGRFLLVLFQRSRCKYEHFGTQGLYETCSLVRKPFWKILSEHFGTI